MIKLRDYQQDAVDSIVKGFSCVNRQFIEMPTGSGKTITFLTYARRHHKKILIVVPSKELMRQVYETALSFYHKSEISRKGDKFDQDIKTVHIAIIHSIKGDYLDYIEYAEFDLIIIDECHHSQSRSYKRLIHTIDDFYEHPYFILGMTATPERRDGKLLSEILGECTFRLTIEDMIEKGQLSDVEGFCVKTKIDLSKVDDHNGDFSIGQLYKTLCTESRNNMIIDIYRKEMLNRKTIIFCINVEHSKIITKKLNDLGISSAHIDGSMNSIERNSILTSFKNGIFNVICNCQLLTEGFDEPSIDGIILARPTKSRPLFIQMVGRGLRLFPGKKNCKIIDIVDNHRKLSGFNSLTEIGFDYECLDKFSSFKEIQDHVLRERIKVTEITIEKIDVLFEGHKVTLDATESMLEYLKSKNIQFFEPISFDEASFLIWFDKLKKEFYGINQKKND